MPGRTKDLYSYTVPLLSLVLVWGFIIWFIGPTGEFMINDDWSFVKALQIVTCDGCVPATGWGNGGPSLLSHLAWGFIFTQFFGFSMTTLRLSVLVMAILGSSALLIFLKRSGASSGLAFWGALTVVANPLFLSQSFTFMTDITLASLMIFSVIFITKGMELENKLVIATGLFFTLAALLTRQIAVAIPITLIFIMFIHPKAAPFGKIQMIGMITLIAVVPWIAFEIALKKLGSTALTDHEVIHAIIDRPMQLGFYGYLRLLFDRASIGIGYISVLASPIIALSFRELYSRKIFRIYFKTVTAIFILVEIAILTGNLNLPVEFHRNVIFDFGVGPILLKDTYLLKLQRGWNLPPALYYYIAYWAVINAGALVLLAHSSISRILRQGRKPVRDVPGIVPTFSLLLSIVYCGIILFTGYHDRYLIPVCVFVIVWLVSEKYESFNVNLFSKSAVPAFVTMAIISLFSVGAVHDLIRMKTALAQAQDYVVNDLGASPCSIDGGFEFNGFHCYRKGHVPKPGLSWWWVDREDYLLALGPLPDYKIESIFPFQRIFPGDGQVHVLKKIETAHSKAVRN